MADRDFFISRAGESSSWGLWVARVLQEERYSVLYQERDFPNGGNILTRMGNANERSERTLVILSDAYFNSRYTESEYTMGAPEGKLLLFRVTKVEPFGVLRPLKYADLFGRDEATARMILLREIRLAYGEPKYPYAGEIEAVEFPGARIPITPDSPAVATTPIVQPSAAPVQPPPAKVSFEVLEGVAYLCDRISQENRLGSILMSESCPRTVICIAHGDEIERVDRFAQRLHTFSVPKYLGDERPIRPIPVEWPKVTRQMTVAVFQTELQVTAARGQLAQNLQDAVAVIRTNLLVTEAVADREKELVQAYVDYWQQKVDVPPNSLLLVCLMIRYPAERPTSMLKRFFGSSRSPCEVMRAVLAEDAPAVQNCHVLPPLGAVDRGELDGWIDLKEVQQYRILTPEDILRIYDEGRIEKIPMGELAPKLAGLLTSRKDAQP